MLVRHNRYMRAFSILLISVLLSESVLWASPETSAVRRDVTSSPEILPQIKIPSSIAVPKDVHKAKGGKKLILIEDAHTNESGQWNIAEALEIILRNIKINTVFLEAGTGDDSLSFLRDKVQVEKRQAAGQALLREGQLSGSEYLSLTSDIPFSLWGVEDKVLYWKALDCYRRLLKARSSLNQYLDSIALTAKTLKTRFYNQKLLRFDQKRTLYLSGRLALTEYFEALLETAADHKIDVKAYSTLENLKQLKNLESEINFEKAEAEKIKALSVLPPDAFGQKQVDGTEGGKTPFKMNTQSSEADRAFFVLLEEKLKAVHYQSPELDKYFSYLHQAESLDYERLAAELDLLERAVVLALINNDTEKSLCEIDHNVGLLKKLFNLSITSDEFLHLKNSKETSDIRRLTGFLNRKIMLSGMDYERWVPLKRDYMNYLRAAESFYELTKRRDEAMVTNIQKKMSLDGEDSAVLIAGGYHTANLKEILKRRQFSYVVYSPRIYQATNQARYEKILLKQSFESKNNTPSFSRKMTNYLMTLPARERGEAMEILRSRLGVELGASGARLAGLPVRPIRAIGKGGVQIGDDVTSGVATGQHQLFFGNPSDSHGTFMDAVLSEAWGLLQRTKNKKSPNRNNPVNDILAKTRAHYSQERLEVTETAGRGLPVAVEDGKIYFTAGLEAIARGLGVEFKDGQLRCSSAENLEAFKALSAMSLLYGLDLAVGHTNSEEEALIHLLEFFRFIPKTTQKILIDSLRKSTSYDSGNCFSFFLEMGLDESVPFGWATLDRVRLLSVVDLDKAPKTPQESERVERKVQTLLRWQRHWARWVLARSKIDEPFDAQGVREAIRKSSSTTELRRRLHEVLNRSYDRQADRTNILKLWRQMRREGRHIWYVLFTRAFWLSALTIANSKSLLISERVQNAAQAVCHFVEDQSPLGSVVAALGEFSPDLSERLRLASLRCRSELANLSLLVGRQGSYAPGMLVTGAIDDVENTYAGIYGEETRKEITRLLRDEKVQRRILQEKEESASVAIFEAHKNETSVREFYRTLERQGYGGKGAQAVRARKIAAAKRLSSFEAELAARRQKASSQTERALNGFIAVCLGREAEFRGHISLLRQAFATTQGRQAGFVFFGRRISKEIGAYDLAMVFYGIDPFTRDWTGAENERVGQMISEAPGSMYISPQDATLEFASAIQIALPLFIHSEHIDYKQLENTLRNWSEPILRNIRRAKDGEYVALARHILVARYGSAEQRQRMEALANDPEAQEEFARSVMETDENLRQQVAPLAALIKKTAECRPMLLEVARLSQSREKEGHPEEPFHLLGDVLDQARIPENLLYSLLQNSSDLLVLSRNLDQAIGEHGLNESALRFQPEARERREPLRTVLIGTTQSSGMTLYLLGSWIVEGLFINKVKDDHSLGHEVKAKEAEYRATTTLAGERAAQLLNLTPRIELGVAAGQPRESVVYDLVTGDYESVLAGPTAAIHLLARIQCTEGGNDSRVEVYIREHRAALEAEANKLLTARYPGNDLANLLKDPVRRQERDNTVWSMALQTTMTEAVAQVESMAFGDLGSVNNYLSQHDAELEQEIVAEVAQARNTTPEQIVILARGEASLRTALDTAKRIRAIEQFTTQVCIRRGLVTPLQPFGEFLDRYFYNLTAISRTTAAKEVIGRHGLSGLALDPAYMMAYRGAFKAFHLDYLPSRIDFGADTEIESIQEWAQWVGATDTLSARAAASLVGFFNKRPAVFRTPFIPEVAKPNENTTLLAEAVNSTVAGLAYNAAGWGDAQFMAHLSNERTPPSPVVNMKPPSDFIAGFCLPKDWEWIRFVNNLTADQQLEFNGVLSADARAHIKELSLSIMRDLKEARRTNNIDRFLEILSQAQERFYQDPVIREHFSVIDGCYVPKIDAAAEALTEFGQTADMGSFRAQLRRISSMHGNMLVQQLEKVNRSMVFVKALLIHRGWELAREVNPTVASFSQMKVVRGSEYKADRFSGAVRDPRNAGGPAILEIFARTRTYALAMFSPKERREVESIIYGSQPKTFEDLIGLCRANNADAVAALLQSLLAAHPNINTAEEVMRYADTDLQTRVHAIEVQGALNLLPAASRQNIMDHFGGGSLPGTVSDLIAGLGPKEAEELAAVWYGINPPAEFCLVTTSGQTAQDILTYHVDATLERHADEAQEALNGAGMDNRAIEAHLLSYGSDLSQWRQPGRGLARLAPRAFQELRDKIQGKVLILSVKINGLFGSYEEALQGADILDAGLPAPELISLIEDPTYLRDLMLYQNPRSALAIVDGASQARPRSMTRHMAQMWMASDPRAIYVSMGVGEETVSEWRSQMETARDQSTLLYESLIQGDFERARRHYESEVQTEASNRARAYLDEERAMRDQYGLWQERDSVLTIRNAAVATTNLENLDFATWLAAGGMYWMNGKTAEELDRARKDFDRAMREYRRWLKAQLMAAGPSQTTTDNVLAPEEVTRLTTLLIKPRKILEAGEFTRSHADTGSLKQAGAVAKTAEEIRRELEILRARQAGAANRRRGYSDAERSLTQGARLAAFHRRYNQAMEVLGDGKAEISQENFGRFLRFARAACEELTDNILPSGDARREVFKKKIGRLFHGGEVGLAEWQGLAGNYTDKGVLGYLAEAVQGGDIEARKVVLRNVAKAAELVYIALVLEKTITYSSMSHSEIPLAVFWKDVATLGSELFYDHVFNYPPIFGQVMRGIGFTDYDEILGPTLDEAGRKKEGKPFTGEEVLSLGAERYAWIYSYLRHLIITKSEFHIYPKDEQDAHLGLVEDGQVKVPALGCGGYTPAQELWLQMAQWREVAFYRSEGQPIPFHLKIDPQVIVTDRRVNLMHIAPTSRQHMMAGVEEAPTLQRRGFPVNVLIGRKVRPVENYQGTGQTVYVADSAYTYLSREDFVRAYVATHGASEKDTAERLANEALAKNPKGIFTVLEFSRAGAVIDGPMPYHGLTPFIERTFEHLGYPHNVNGSFPFYLFAYDKSEYHNAYDPERGSWVIMPPEMQWYQSWTQGRSKDEVMREILEGREGFIGLRKFFEAHPTAKEFIIKAARQSGGRQSDTFSLPSAESVTEDARSEEAKEKELLRAAEFIYEQSKTDHFVVQLYIFVHPGMILTPQAYGTARDRIVAKGISVQVNRQPKTFLTIFGRVMVAYTPKNQEAMLKEQEPGVEPSLTVFHHLFGISVDRVGNVGRGGIIEEMLPNYFPPAIRQAVYRRIEDHARESIRSIETYLNSDTFRRKYREQVGQDPDEKTLAGMRYSLMSYAMFDILVAPVFARKDTRRVLKDGQAQLVDIEIIPDAKGNPADLKVWMRTKDGTVFEASLIDVDIIKIEDNAGTGLKHPFKVAQKDRLQRQAVIEGRLDAQGEPIILPDQYGEQVGVMLAAFANMARVDAKKRYGKDVPWGDGLHDEIAHMAQPGGTSVSVEETSDIAVSMQSALVAAAQAMTSAGARLAVVFNRDNVNVFLKNLLLSKAQRQYKNLRERALSDAHFRQEELPRRLFNILYNNQKLAQAMVQDKANFDISAADARNLLSDREYIHRIIELVLEAILMPATMPELLLPQQQEKVSKISAKYHISAVLFENGIGIGPEAYTLMREALAFNQTPEGKARPVFLMAVRRDWLDDKGRARKAFYLNPETGYLVEVTFDEPLAIQSAMIRNLYLGTEQAHFRDMAEFMAKHEIPLINPEETVNLADSKIATFRILQRGGVETPSTLFLARGMSASQCVREINQFLSKANANSSSFILQPNNGTEGMGVEAFALDGPVNESSPIAQAILNHFTEGASVILRPAVGNLLYSEDGANFSRAVVRVNVYSDGFDYEAVSGLGQVSSGADRFNTARQEGGKIVTFSEGFLSRLYMDVPGSAPRRLTEAERKTLLERLRQTAVNSAKAINADRPLSERTLCFGMDIAVSGTLGDTLDFNGSVLDINARPGLLVYAQNFQDSGALTDKSGGAVTPAILIWKGILGKEQVKNHGTANASSASPSGQPNLLVRQMTVQLSRPDSSVRGRQRLIGQAERLLRNSRRFIAADQRTRLQRALKAAKARLKEAMLVRGKIFEPTGVFRGFSDQPPGMVEPVNLDAGTKNQMTDPEIQAIWDQLREADEAGEDVCVAANLRVVSFGGGQDGEAINPFIRHPKAIRLEDVPSLILLPGGGNIKAKISLAQDAEGRHLPNVIQYVNKELGINKEVTVPMALEPDSRTKRGQIDAVAYILGNVFGLRGIRIEVTIEEPVLMLTGGFEASSVYNLILALIGQNLGDFVKRKPVSSAQLFALLRRLAKYELNDVAAGGQGFLVALADSPSRHFFVGGLHGPNNRPLAGATVFQKPLDDVEHLIPWIEKNMAVVIPGKKFKNGRAFEERRGAYTSGMMVDLARHGDEESLKKIQRWRELVTIIETALMNKDIHLLREAVDEYTDIRIGFQLRWLTLAQNPGDPFYDKKQKDPYLKNLSPRLEDCPYLGGHSDLLILARRHHLGVMPMGAGGFGGGWQFFGKPKDLKAFLRAAKFKVLNTEKARKVLEQSQQDESTMRGKLHLKLESGRAAGMSVAFKRRFVRGAAEAVTYDQGRGVFSLVTAGARLAVISGPAFRSFIDYLAKNPADNTTLFTLTTSDNLNASPLVFRMVPDSRQAGSRLSRLYLNGEVMSVDPLSNRGSASAPTRSAEAAQFIEDSRFEQELRRRLILSEKNLDELIPSEVMKGLLSVNAFVGLNLAQLSSVISDHREFYALVDLYLNYFKSEYAHVLISGMDELKNPERKLYAKVRVNEFARERSAERGKIVFESKDSAVAWLHFFNGSNPAKVDPENGHSVLYVTLEPGAVPDFLAGRVAFAQAAFYAQNLVHGKIPSGDKIDGASKQFLEAFVKDPLFTVLRDRANDRKGAMAMSPKEIHQIAITHVLTLDRIRILAVRPIWKFLNDRLKALQTILRVVGASA